MDPERHLPDEDLDEDEAVVEDSNVHTIVTPDTKLLTVSVTAAYNMVVIALFLFIINMFLQDALTSGIVEFHAEIFWWCWSSVHIALSLWAGMLASLMLMHVCLIAWANIRENLPKESLCRWVWDRCSFVALVLFLSAFLVLPGMAVHLAQMPPSSTGAVLVEQIRMLMKAYAYVRTQIPSVLGLGVPACAEGLPAPRNGVPNRTFSHFMYFLFAPTLVYQEEYARTSRVKKLKVLRHVLEMGVCTVTVYLLVMRCIQPLSRELLVHPDQDKVFGLSGPMAGVVNWLIMMVRVTPSSIFLALILFYIILNASQMIFAELLRFQDRRFYLDWWNVSSFKMWFRTWNLLVQRWLYRYVFKELNSLGVHLIVTRLAVFILSSVFHEYVIALSLDLFYPMQIFMFGFCGLVLTYFDPWHGRASAGGNTFVQFSFFFGFGIMITSYCLEYQARHHCPRVLPPWQDLFVPRSWFCSQQYKEGDTFSF